MKDDMPVIYWTFRTVWTLIHFALVAAAVAFLLTWAFTDNQAIRTSESAKISVLGLQHRVSNLIPWPWAMDEQKSESTALVRTLTIQLEGDVNVRTEPNSDSMVVDVVKSGSQVEVNCKVEYGELVSAGPYGPTSRWDHIYGVGYISDAWVSTITTDLPIC